MMVKPLASLFLSIISENVLKVHFRAKTQMLYKRLKIKDPSLHVSSST